MLDIDDIIQSDAYDDESKHKPACCPPMSLGIKPVPPPPPLNRKLGPVVLKAHKVVYPPKESCFNLPIIFPSLAESSLKSRVETQIRVTIDLAHPSSSPDPTIYDRVGSWKYLKLPQGTATKRRSRKQGRIDPDPQDILYLTFSVNCATEPHSRVVSCTSCQTREAKRVAKKIAARVRPPAPSDSEADDYPNDPSNPTPKIKHEDPSSIIQFNCSPLIDFSSGSTALPLRITCYCRHHREKVGFHVNLTLVDFMGRVVGAGTTKPIMITDDHKSGNQTRSLQAQQTVFSHQLDWQSQSPPGAMAPSKRKTAKDAAPLTTAAAKKKRAKPYDSSAKPNRHPSSRETSLSLSSAPSPDTSASSPSPSQDQDVGVGNGSIQDQEMSPLVELLSQVSAATPPSSSEIPPLKYEYGYTSHPQDSLSESSPDGLITPTDLGPASSLDLDVAMLNDATSDTDLFGPNNNSNLLPFLSLFSNIPHNPTTTVIPPPPPPTIHRLIPSCGPTHGGIEVTVLGANFHMTLVNELTCVFGGVEATSTTRWSDNALVCVLPPRAQAGVVDVEVRVKGEDKPPELGQQQPPQQPTLFTYSDESDRALMELALQVVGLKMTGKIEDAKNVAMRIVGGGGDATGGNNNSSNNSTPAGNAGSVTNALFTPTSDLEKLVMEFLALLDVDVDVRGKTVHEALRHVTQSGQTLLHMAAYTGYPRLLQFLVERWEGDGEVDKRDKNGWTALHFACLRLAESADAEERRVECVRILMRAGADVEVVDASGKTAEEVGGERVSEVLAALSLEKVAAEDEDAEQEPSQVEGDEDEWWGDAEDDDAEDENLESVRDRARKRRQMRKASRREKEQETPAPDPATPSQPISKEKEAEAEKEKTDMGPDEKQALSFLDMLSRTMAQLPGAPALPQLPVGLPNLPIPALAFPVMLPALFSGTPNAGQAENAEDPEKPGVREWSALWEKWILWQQRHVEEEAPPQYTPRAEPASPVPPQSQLIRRRSGSESAAAVEEPVASTSQIEEVVGPQTSRNAASKRVTMDSYQHTHVTEQDLSEYRYLPKTKQKKGLKGDKMLVLFWIPILISEWIKIDMHTDADLLFTVSLIWACHTGLQFAIRAVKTPMGWSLKKVVSGH
ncbi:SPT3 Dosage dependent suppressor of Ty-induced promoter mutations-like protein [Marasmius crinis-equi]|uniref:SPT3 Dosage dependent suppressor of Ty-induced promoter mutations-like protein n=1 Tax=Marasmius crinis-equi TaxID=585013 RepID=A0ABR3FS59_9AGAR